MQNLNIEKYIDSVSSTNKFKKRLKALLPVLSIIIIIIVFWCLKLTGITMAGEAFCGNEEHVHTEECLNNEVTCEVKEHIHDASCYSNKDADIETAEIWEKTIPEIPQDISQNQKIILVAESQLNYTESELNYIIGDDSSKKGYTRYGEWYGNPYGEWSVMFTSFCLNYAGIDNVPFNSGAEPMMNEWKEENIYKSSEDYSPVAGDIVFLDKDNSGYADATAIIKEVTGASITVIEGDLQNKVSINSYEINDKVIIGYGLIKTPNLIRYSKAINPKTSSNQTIVGKTTSYNAGNFSTNGEFILYSQGSDGNYYAIDGNANAVRVYVDSSGNITTDISNTDSILWTFEYCGVYENQNSYYIQNVATGMYLHPYYNSSSDNGAIISGKWESAIYIDGNGVNIQGARQESYAWLRQTNDYFTRTGNINSASTFYFGKAADRYAVWLDGTLGGLMGLGGSPNEKYICKTGEKFTLPSQWKSPDKYNYTLQGWYEVRTNKYYKPGEEITVTDNMVLYADWVASTYDVGQYNAEVSNTVSTNDFITTNVFDYNSLFNVMSEKADTNVSLSSHNETWSMIKSGNVPYKNQETLNFIFLDYDANGDISYPNNRDNININGDIYSGIYSDKLGEILFKTDNAYDPETGNGIIGKKYLGTADHLFKINQDPTSEHYGYYYYDSKLNAASYNQTDKRFYVYDYLERTADSQKDGGGGEYSDFLPFNSPYANTNGKTLNYYQYAGESGEYQTVTHVQYDAKYNTNNNSVNNVGTNYGFGMSIDIDFYLPESPGSVDANGNYGNQDLYGKDMHFKFSGDDDVWVLLDGKLVLDIGGVHGIESGDINFATGTITVNGEQKGVLEGVGEGEHRLTVYYLERGSSQSNCAIYFNLAPRFNLSIQKEDVLTQELLNGAEFSVYTDKECTVPAELWESKSAHDNKKESTNVFAVKEGIANIWGFSAGKTYYIKETKPPDAKGYSLASGIISLSLDKRGVASYSVDVIKDKDENGNPLNISNGFTVHGFKIDEETQQAYIVVTNAQDWVTETTTVQISKKWNDNLDHTYDAITAYLTITDPDGTVRRIREITLSEENNWSYIWTSLPKYYIDGVTEVQYGAEEAYKEGYAPSVERIEEITVTEYEWAEAVTMLLNNTYYLSTDKGFLAAVSESSTEICWLSEEKARNNPLAKWTVTNGGSGKVILTNEAGQKLTFNYANNGSYYSASKTNGYNKLGYTTSESAYQFYFEYGAQQYIGTLLENGKLYEGIRSGGTQNFVLKQLITKEVVKELDDYSYNITNTPLEEETSLKVTKEWDLGMSTDVSYERAQVTVKLLANGKDTGRTVTLNLKNNWTDVFRGLPYKDENGNVIQYAIEESWETEDWLPVYGEIKVIKGDIPTYETTVTNSYRWGHGYELPATGGPTLLLLVLGAMTMIGALVCGYILRRKRERGGG